MASVNKEELRRRLRENLRKFRGEEGYSQEEVAQLLGVSAPPTPTTKPATPPPALRICTCSPSCMAAHGGFPSIIPLNPSRKRLGGPRRFFFSLFGSPAPAPRRAFEESVKLVNRVKIPPVLVALFRRIV